MCHTDIHGPAVSASPIHPVYPLSSASPFQMRPANPVQGPPGFGLPDSSARRPPTPKFQHVTPRFSIRGRDNLQSSREARRAWLTLIAQPDENHHDRPLSCFPVLAIKTLRSVDQGCIGIPWIACRQVSAFLASGALLVQSASAHYIFQTLNGGSPYQYFRTNTNYNSPVTDTTSTDMRCNVGALTGGSTGTYTVSAGTSVTLGLDTAVYHNGPILFYLGRVPSGQTAQSWDGSGTNWGPNFSGGSVTWPLSQTYSVTIPAGIPAGQWLLRAEQIGIHNPYPAGIPQFYIGCLQLQVTGGGSCSPSYFNIPGHIRENDPGITVNIYNNFNSYTYPGPAPQSCSSGGGGGGGGNPTTTRTTTRATTTLSTRTTTGATRTTTTTRTTTGGGGGGGTGAPLYGQCGGNGWTGPTTCAQGTCKVLNPYYSQCT
ncbi:Endoglucanase-4 [Drechslerella dactyloides]|uniref:AA9 family lytic polysaccharide monooxygenase n=1 Tax=Drechslerella dactyloides TaxID=74499 RepID=A0AAD6IW40_DREDA|nr:Endoglucanase-4 [Drechslerella dactyloides]